MQSLFGMNVDVLESNPSWWFYIPLAVVLMIVTLSVWLIFKYNPGVRVTRSFPRPSMLTEYVAGRQSGAWIQSSRKTVTTTRS
jgi:uncharacterized protein (DUF58 family)